MKKTILALSTIALVSTSASASASASAFDLSPEYFVGGGVGYHTAKFESAYEDVEGNEIYSGKDSNTAKGAAFHIRAGAYLTPNHRITLTANFTGDNELFVDEDGDKDELKQNEYLVSYDYIHQVAPQISLFAGGTLGAVQNKLTMSWTDEDGSGKDTVKETDFTYGLQVGAQYKINANWSADLQYRHMFESTSVSETESWEAGYEKDTHTVKNNGELTLSVDYRF